MSGKGRMYGEHRDDDPDMGHDEQRDKRDDIITQLRAPINRSSMAGDYTHLDAMFNNLKAALHVYADLAAQREPDPDAIASTSHLIGQLWREIIMAVTPFEVMRMMTQHERMRRVKTAYELQKALGMIMPHLAAVQGRTIERYAELFKAPGHTWGDPFTYELLPPDERLLMPEAAAEGVEFRRDERLAAIEALRVKFGIHRHHFLITSMARPLGQRLGAGVREATAMLHVESYEADIPALDLEIRRRQKRSPSLTILSASSG